MTIYHIDPRVQAGGTGTLINPYSIADFMSVIPQNGDQNGDSYLFRAGTYCRPATTHGLNFSVACNFTVGFYGTGAKPVIAGSSVYTGLWTQYIGTIWSTPHTRADSWMYDEQSSNGIATSSRAFGHQLLTVSATDLSTAMAAASGLTTANSVWFDAVNNLTYVNLGGANPNSVLLSYTYASQCIRKQYNNATLIGPVTIAGVVFANAWNGCGHLMFPDGTQKCTLLDTEWYHGYSLASTDNPTNLQLQGARSLGSRMPELLIDNIVVKDGFGGALDLLNVKGFVHNVQIDNCIRGIGLWNDIQDLQISRGLISNICKNPTSTSVQDLGFGIYSAANGTGWAIPGANGRAYRNTIEGIVFANGYGSSIHIENGGSWDVENNTLYGTSEQLASMSGYRLMGSAVTFISNDVTVDPQNNMDVRFNNNVVVSAQNNNHCLAVGTAGAISGDYNHYYQTGGSAPLNPFGAYPPDTYATLADWQAAMGPLLDVNSTLEVLPSTKALPFAKAGTLGVNPEQPGYSMQYLSGFDCTPSVSTQGVVIWNLDMLPPTLASADLSQTAGGTLAAATYYVVTTLLGPRGETVPSAEQSLAVLADNLLNVAAPTNIPGWAVGYNVYVGTVTGAWTKQNALPVTLGAAWVEPIVGLVTGQLPPTRKPSRSPAEDGVGRAFYAIPSVGGLQLAGPNDPAIQY